MIIYLTHLDDPLRYHNLGYIELGTYLINLVSAAKRHKSVVYLRRSELHNVYLATRCILRDGSICNQHLQCLQNKVHADCNIDM